LMGVHLKAQGFFFQWATLIDPSIKN
jgi:hypothetical protein